MTPYRKNNLVLWALLTKPGILLANLVTATSGFLLASKASFDLPLFLYTVTGLSSVIASAAIFNNIIDKDIDRKMERTKERALANNTISTTNATLAGVFLLLFGLFTLALKTTPLATLFALFGFLVYVILYSLAKRKGRLATEIGSFAGACPPVVGYFANGGSPDSGALLLFLFLLLWQMPHFFAIALWRMNDYKKAGIDVLPLQRGIFWTKWEMLLYTALFFLAALALFWFGIAGTAHAGIALILSAVWIGYGIAGFWTKDDQKWGRRSFILSLVVLFSLSFSMNFF